VPLSGAGSDDDGRPIEFDVFISHAYGDKETFVRPLAEALIAGNLRPWYDEFTLRPGDSLRRSIDHGLLTSQAGVVVLSPAFFGKRWTNYELDGLVQLATCDHNQVAGAGSGGRLLPVWHEVGADDVARYSPCASGKGLAVKRKPHVAVPKQPLEQRQSPTPTAINVMSVMRAAALLSSSPSSEGLHRLLVGPVAL
jgi:hypothetical protein